MTVDTASFAPVPGGHITMRDARTGGARDVVLRPFSICTTPVQSGPANVPAHAVTWFAAIEWCNAASAASGIPAAYSIDGRNVRWNIDSDGYRLPTEAEWEFACRAGADTPTYGPLSEVAWTATDGVDGPQAVAQKAPNNWGLYDTLGNVWEWCWDYADTARYGDYRALRGGGWADQSWSCRASVRRGSAPDAILEDVGFRGARGAVRHSDADDAQGWSAVSDRERASIRGPLPIGWTPLRSLL